MYALLNILHDWIYVQKVNRYLERMEKNPNIFSIVPTKELIVLISENERNVSFHENDDSFKILRSRVCMELIRRGVDIPCRTSDGFRHVLIRWAYLHQHDNAHLYDFVEKERAREIEERNDPTLTSFYYTALLTNQALDQPTWENIIEYFDNFYTILYREQNKFKYVDVDIIPTDMCENNVIVFRDMPTKESAFACVHACIHIFTKKTIADTTEEFPESIPEKIDRIFSNYWKRELTQLQHWVQTCYPDDTVLNMLDFLLNPTSGMHIIYQLSDPATFSFEPVSTTFEETSFLY